VSHARSLLALLLTGVLLAAPVSAQGRNCELVVDSLPNSSLWQVKDPFSGRYTTWWSGGFRARCVGTSMVISADSAEYLGAAELLILIGNARYREDGTALDANELRYFEQDARLEALGDARLRDATGSTLTARQIFYLRELPGVRGASSIVLGTPRARLRDSVRMPDSLTTVVDAHRMYTLGDSAVYAGGDVVITRPDLVARADSAEAFSARERLRLLGQRPTMEATGDQPFTLAAQRIEVSGRDRLVREVWATGSVEAQSDSLRLRGDSLLMSFEAGQVERVRTWAGPERARASTGGREITADSLDIRLPGQRIEELWAIGAARVETPADTAVVSDEPDWLAGDTVRARFQSGADSAAQPVLRDLEARGNARSYFQLASPDSSERRPSVNYVTGRRIDVEFQAGEVREVRVSADARGVLIQPAKPTDPPVTSTTRRGGGR
jgi:lipopolysaccharide export system protein LptA